MIRHPVGTDDYAASVLYYDSAGRVWLVLDQQWSVADGEPENCQKTRLTVFRYDLTGRRRATATSTTLSAQPPGPVPDLDLKSLFR
ncbi:MAG: hypothetical protein L6Q92_05650 [Phycisphaerae bacterium]|nr:hypothetical protein [Phycisphaerae bacterium]